MTAALRPRIARSDIRQFGRFVAVGVVNTGFSYAIYAALVFAGLGYAVANLVALVVGMLFSFKTQGALVFGNTENRWIFRFVAVWSAIYALNIFVISRFIALGFDAYVGGALAIPIVTVLSYGAQKFFVFRTPVRASVDAGVAVHGRVATPLDRRVRWARGATLAVVIAATWVWHVRTTGAVSPSAFAFLAGFVLAVAAFGRLSAGLASGIVPQPPGIAYELVLGFLAANTLLFVLTLASPLGIGLHVAVLAGVAALIVVSLRRRAPMPGSSLQGELASLACAAFSALAATLWMRDQQPVTTIVDGSTVFTVWLDVFIHVREISAFAQAHGPGSITDIKLAGVVAPVYHFASYMIPAALNALTQTTALDSYAAFQLPFGILLVGLSAYALAAVVLKTTWPAVFASAVLLATPDSFQQGFGIRYLSYHFMTQVNLGMLYGIACMAIAWLFMIEACRRERLSGVAAAYGLLAVCVCYKAHLFAANALILMLYPCLFFGRVRWRWRILLAISLVAVFVAVAWFAQQSPRMPTFRADGSGIAEYIRILMGGFTDGELKSRFDSLYFARRNPWIVNAALGAMLILLGSFGYWIVAAPVVLWWARRRLGMRAVVFVALIVGNYLAMSMLLALDQRGVGTPEELVNRPQAWAYFVVVVFVAAAVAIRASGVGASRPRWLGGIAAVLAGLMLFFVHGSARNLQTFPQWDEHAEYAQFNAVPTCLVRAAEYVRGHARSDELVQDSGLDPRFIVTAISERQDFVADATFGGGTGLVAARLASLKTVLAAADGDALEAWGHANGVGWFLMRPGDTERWDRRFVDRAAYRCEGYRVFRLGW